MYLWKFRVGGKWQEISPGVAVMGVMAVVVAESEESARVHLRRFAAENGCDARWLDVAEVIQLPIAPGTVGGWAEV